MQSKHPDEPGWAVDDATRPTLSRPATRVLLVVMIALIALAPAQLAVRKVAGELYPSLMMPSFGNESKNHDVRFRSLSFRADLEGGGRMDVPIDSLMPKSATLPAIIATVQFADSATMSSPAVAEWLRDRLELAYPGKRFTRLDVIWTKRSFDPATGDGTARVDARRSYSVALPTGDRS
jgi:hypothetical protein